MKIQFKQINFLKPQNGINKTNSSFLKYRYDLSSDTISFSGKSISQQVKELPKEAFLSEGLREYILANIDKKNIIDLHKEYYASLVDCRNLDEAKKIYPEFANVVDMWQLDLKELNNTTLKQIARGKFENLTFENAAVEFLKRYVAQLEPIENNEREYFNLYAATVKKVLGYFNISMDKRYERLIKIERISQSNKKVWQDDEKRAQQSINSKIFWQDEDYRLKTVGAMNDVEYKKLRSEIMKANWQNEDFIVAFQISQIAKRIAILKYQSSPKSEFSHNSDKEIAKLQKEILSSWGFYDKNRDLDKILQLAHSLEI